MIQMQLSAQDDVVSHVIMDWTRGQFSHVDIVTPKGTLIGARSDVHIIGGVTYPAGVIERPAGYAPFTATKLLTFEVGHDDSFWQFVQAQIGKPYDKGAIAGLALDRDWHNPNQWFCSELAAAALEAGAFINPLPTGVWFVSPRDIDIIGAVA